MTAAAARAGPVSRNRVAIDVLHAVNGGWRGVQRKAGLLRRYVVLNPHALARPRGRPELAGTEDAAVGVGSGDILRLRWRIDDDLRAIGKLHVYEMQSNAHRAVRQH